MRILFFDDNPDFGGHQIMSQHALAGILRLTDWQVSILGNPANARNQQGWTALAEANPGRIAIEVAATQTRKLQSLRSHFERGRHKRLLRQIHAAKPEIILCSQGNIEQCSSLLALAGRLPCPLISYIPLPHGHAEMGAKFGCLRDLFCHHLYKCPDAFITLSSTLAEALVAKGARTRPAIVANGIPVQRFPADPDRLEARKILQLPDKGFYWLLPGRTEFKQKGQDFALHVFRLRQQQKKYTDEHLILLGSGPDSSALAEMAKDMERVHLMAWSDNPAQVIAAADALVLPSRYEGVPLVMLEAMAMGRPVCATDRDGMRDWLPQQWRFPYRDIAAASQAMDALRSEPHQLLSSIQAAIRTQHSIEQFQQDFVACLMRWDALKA